MAVSKFSATPHLNIKSIASLQTLTTIVIHGVGSLHDMETTLQRLDLAVTPSLFLQFLHSLRNPTVSVGRRLLRLFSWCRRQENNRGLAPAFGDDAFNMVIRALAQMKDVTAVMAAVADLQKEGRRMDPQTFELVVMTLVSSGKPEEAVRLFRRVEEKRELLVRRCADDGEWSCASAVIHALCTKGHARKAVGVLWHHKDKLVHAAPTISRSILHGWCVHGNVGEARRILDQMKSGGNPPGLASYNDFLYCVCRRNLRFNPSALVPEATNLMAEMRASGVAPTTVSYNILISCLSKTRRVKEACGILQSMIQGKGSCSCSPDWVSYYLVIKLLFLTGRFGRGNRLVEHMFEIGMVPGVKFYHGLVGILCGMDKMKCALEMFDRMKQSGLVSNGAMYDLLIEKLCRNGEFDMGRHLWDEAVERGIVLQSSSDLLDPLKTEVFKPVRPLKKLDASEYKMLMLKAKGVRRARLKLKPKKRHARS
ncbi:putative tetratricopeptide-like helical domain superfamily [Dioscorea sansibarensis]